MNVLRKRLTHDAVLWSATGLGDDGKATYATPVGILCRWEESFRREGGNEDSQETSRATVLTQAEVNEGDYLMLGELNSDVDDDPTAQAGAYLVRGINNLNNLRDSENLRTVTL